MEGSLPAAMWITLSSVPPATPKFSHLVSYYSHWVSLTKSPLMWLYQVGPGEWNVGSGNVAPWAPNLRDKSLRTLSLQAPWSSSCLASHSPRPSLLAPPPAPPPPVPPSSAPSSYHTPGGSWSAFCLLSFLPTSGVAFIHVRSPESQYIHSDILHTVIHICSQHMLTHILQIHKYSCNCTHTCSHTTTCFTVTDTFAIPMATLCHIQSHAHTYFHIALYTHTHNTHTHTYTHSHYTHSLIHAPRTSLFRAPLCLSRGLPELAP